MKRSLISLGVAACCLVFTSGALAHGPGNSHRGHERAYHSHRHDAHHGKYRQRSDERRGRAAPAWHRGPPPHVRYAPRWERGARIPPRYLHERYVVRDWHRHKFSRPPRGYQWVNVGTDYLLVGIATGVILQAVLSN